jgi:hypothetical protein
MVQRFDHIPRMLAGLMLKVCLSKPFCCPVITKSQPIDHPSGNITGGIALRAVWYLSVWQGFLSLGADFTGHAIDYKGD